MSSATPTAPEREDFALRLLKGSAKKSYEPVVDIDWAAPLPEGLYFLPPHMLSLYGTPLWERMTDEARHMLMFGKAIERVGVEPFWPTKRGAHRVNAMAMIFRGPMLWINALVGEELFDAVQRQILDDGDDIQPLVRRVMRIHVTEEARHIQFARDGIRRDVGTLSPRTRLALSNLHGLGASLYFGHFTRRALYDRIGLDGAEAQRQARANPHFHATLRAGFGPLEAFLREVGLMGPVARRMWAKNHFL